MKSMFALFPNYEDCQAAFEALLDERFDRQGFNVIVDEAVAKTHIDVDLSEVDVRASEKVGGREEGLDIWLGKEQPVVMPPLGKVYAAGTMATILAKTAAAPDGGGLRDTLADFNVSDPAAKAFAEAMLEGALLFWVRTEDQRASEAAEILRRHNGLHVTNYGG
ncbi:MAG: hypothetical protein ACOC8C_00575 [Chloroflexota bacterium]